MKRMKLFAIGIVAVAAVAFTSCAAEPKTMSINYPFSGIYVGSHGSMTGTVKLTESGNQTTVNVTLNNTMNGQDYNVHVHDAADTSQTPNNTPYWETPNANVCVMTIAGNGGTATKDFTSTMSYSALVDNYAGGYFVVHDPTQAISTTDLTTYLIVGAFNP
jgi:hypothetical protein